MSNEVLTLREMQQDDLELVRSWRNHPDVRCHMLTQHEISAEEHSKWFHALKQDSQRHVVLVHEQQQPLGLAHFTPVNPHGVVDWGFYLTPQAPQGSGSKLARKALEFAFKQQGWHKVCGQVISINAASRRFHLKLGFTLEGVMRQQAFIADEWLSLWCYGLLASDWKPL
jgi:UDP-4-amino-4,6-dideoxy-N-acetyl-beta-L-altrosamine N-acetyltransferase